MPRIEMRNLSRHFPSGVGLRDITWSIPDGQTVWLIGPSGSGKTTLLRVLAGLEPLDQGELHFDGRRMNDVPPHLRSIAYVTQRPALYPQWTVAANLAFALPYAETRLPGIVNRLKIAHLLSRLPMTLSAGEQQRVAFARFLMREASIWLLDEPFASLDPPIRANLLHELHLLQGEFRATMIFVTHELNEALAYHPHLAVLDGGRVVQVGSPMELRDRPFNQFVAWSLESPAIQWFAGCLQTRPHGATYFRSDDGAMDVALTGIGAMGATDVRVVLGLRAHDVRIGSSGHLALGEWIVTRCDPQPGSFRVTVQRDASTLQGWATSELTIGSRHPCWAPMQAWRFFAEGSGNLLTPTPALHDD